MRMRMMMVMMMITIGTVLEVTCLSSFAGQSAGPRVSGDPH